MEIILIKHVFILSACLLPLLSQCGDRGKTVEGLDRDKTPNDGIIVSPEGLLTLYPNDNVLDQSASKATPHTTPKVTDMRMDTDKKEIWSSFSKYVKGDPVAEEEFFEDLYDHEYKPTLFLAGRVGDIETVNKTLKRYENEVNFLKAGKPYAKTIQSEYPYYGKDGRAEAKQLAYTFSYAPKIEEAKKANDLRAQYNYQRKFEEEVKAWEDDSIDISDDFDLEEPKDYWAEDGIEQLREDRAVSLAVAANIREEYEKNYQRNSIVRLVESYMEIPEAQRTEEQSKQIKAAEEHAIIETLPHAVKISGLTGGLLDNEAAEKLIADSKTVLDIFESSKSKDPSFLGLEEGIRKVSIELKIGDALKDSIALAQRSKGIKSFNKIGYVTDVSSVTQLMKSVGDFFTKDETLRQEELDQRAKFFQWDEVKTAEGIALRNRGVPRAIITAKEIDEIQKDTGIQSLSEFLMYLNKHLSTERRR